MDSVNASDNGDTHTHIELVSNHLDIKKVISRRTYHQSHNRLEGRKDD